MGKLYKFSLLETVRNKSEMFWPLVFPLILATLFYFTFGLNTVMEMSPVAAAVVKGGNTFFETFLDQMDGTALTLQEMEEEEALKALRDGTIEGIFYSGAQPSLEVAGVQMNESILETLLNTYLQNQRLMEEIGSSNPLKIPRALKAVSEYQSYVEPVSTGGNTLDDGVAYFFALIGMACLFGAFSGMTAAGNLRADQSALASRRSIVPVSRMKMVLSEMLAVFTVQFANICILLLYLHFGLHISLGQKWPLLIPVCILGSMTGVSYGIFIGCQRMKEGIKVGLLVGSSLLMSFLAGLMMGNMKDIVERHMPILNRINPAALISDAFYSISVYENPARYRMSLLILAVITVTLTCVSFVKLGRERYDSL